MNSGILVLSFLSVMLLLEGCIIVPIPTTEDKILAGRPVNEAQLSFLAPKITTREKVVEHLGNPDIIWEDARVVIYNWEMRQGILFWAAGAYYSGGAGMKDITRHHLLLIQFDEQDKVLRFSRTTRPLTQSYADFLREWLKEFPAQPEAGPHRME
jgi:outer membrane protein assembly factor BamE (lipoprotein component of BamABCDE complex)